MPSKEGSHQVDVEFTNLSGSDVDNIYFSVPQGVTLPGGVPSNCTTIATGNSCKVRFKVNASEALAAVDKVVVDVNRLQNGMTQKTSLVIGTNVFNVHRPEVDNDTPKGGGGGTTSLGFVILTMLAFFTRRFK